MPGSIRSATSPARPAVLGVLGALIAAAVLACVSGCGGSSHAAATAALGGASAHPSAPVSAPASAPPSAPASVPSSAPPPATSTAAPGPAGRLTAAQLPAGAVEKWQSIAPARTQTVTGRGVQINECASVHGADTWQQQAYSSVYQTPAEQDVFTFPSSSAAYTAEQSLAAEMAGCQSTSRALQSTSHIVADAQVTRTAATAQSGAWSRTWTGVEGLSAAGPQTDHLYAVQVGSTLAVIHFDQWAASHSAPYSTRADQALLSAVARQLGQ